MPSITKALISTSSGNRPGIKLHSCKGIIVHRTGNPNTTARANRNYFNSNHGPGKASSAHYIVDEKEILLCIPENEVAWHCRNANYTYIGIELCEPITSAQHWENFIWLVADICKRHNFKANPDYIQPHSKYDPINRPFCAWSWKYFCQNKDSEYNLYNPFTFFEHVLNMMIGGSVNMANGVFKDIPDDHWAKNMCETLGNMGLLSGKSFGQFCGTDALSRYEGAALMYRTLQKCGVISNVKAVHAKDEVKILDNFNDSDEIQGFYNQVMPVQARQDI